MRKILFAGLLAAVVAGSFAGYSNRSSDATIVGPGPHGVIEMAQNIGSSPSA